LHQHGLLDAFDDEISSGIVDTFFHGRNLIVALSMETAFARSEHDWDPSDLNSILGHDLSLSRVTNIHIQWSRVRAVTETTLKWSHWGKTDRVRE
jgi:hypothetical protein